MFEEEFREICLSRVEDVSTISINPKDLIFEENVKMNCFYCGKYGNNWRCPPNLPKIDYKEMFNEFEFGTFIITKWKIENDKIPEDIRRDSSVNLHKSLLDIEKFLWNKNKSTALSFGAGACKLCKDGCGKERCNNPYMSRSPIEATGINVVKSLKKYGFDVVFPPKEYLLRIGLVVWQE